MFRQEIFNVTYVFPNLSRLVQTCPNLFKLVQTCPNLSKLVQTHLNLFKSISDDDDDFEGELGEGRKSSMLNLFPKQVQTCPNLSEIVEIDLNLLAVQCEQAEISI